ncbi:TetR/AcrR family transcriptional regulator [Cognatiyoonia sp. IB215446]|uniref:TetR/AcrR family transcriptional regulator n=1 Tax=Cognatiyoonia sp. IB215446 TaxID=3097355 RepID=UPI002A0ABA8C|nr:TetR/AcrR family transcriptional regulator [Cognatiyoonia sp. IB215446]MDX8350650.1 TetR/AcrR family transcriptional regulator [Cognatiyoonia sp. IB215446]
MPSTLSAMLYLHWKFQVEIYASVLRCRHEIFTVEIIIDKPLKIMKKNYHHGDLKRALIDAGLVELEESGVEGLSMRKIASRVGVSHTAPKNHFDGFRGLLTALATRGFEMQVAAMLHATAPSDEIPDRVGRPGNGYFAFALEHPELYKLMFSRTLTDGTDEELRRASQASYDILRGIAAELSDQQGDHRLTEWALWSLVHGYAILMIEGEIPRSENGDVIYDVRDLIAGLHPTRSAH